MKAAIPCSTALSAAIGDAIHTVPAPILERILDDALRAAHGLTLDAVRRWRWAHPIGNADEPTDERNPDAE